MSLLKECLQPLKASVLGEAYGGPHLEHLSGLIKVVEPIDTKVTVDWHTLESPRRLRKIIELYDSATLQFFVNELLDYEAQIGHNAKIMIEGTHITVEVYTHDLNDVTDVDRDYARMVDSIYEDAIDIMNRKNMLAKKRAQW